MRSGDKTNASNKQGSGSPPRDSASRRAAPDAPGSAVQTTPRQQQTPKKLDWTVDKIAERLREFANDLGEQHNIMIHRMIGDNSRAMKERRLFEGEDLFANVKMPPMPEDKSLTVRIKFKVSTHIDIPSLLLTARLTNLSVATLIEHPPEQQ